MKSTNRYMFYPPTWTRLTLQGCGRPGWDSQFLGSWLEQGGTRRGEPLPQKATEVQIPTLALRLLSRYLSRQLSYENPEPRSPHLGRPLLEAGTWNDA